MASLKSIPFKAKNDAGEEMAFAGACSVDSDGIFAITIPDELAETARALLNRDRVRCHSLRVNKPRTNTRVESTSLAAAESFVREAMRSHLAVSVTRERVICYSHRTRYTAWQNSDGVMVPNGYFGDYHQEPHGRWRGPLNATENDDSFSIGFVARVFDRVTSTRDSHTKTAFLPPAMAANESNPHLDRLQGFIGITKFKPNAHTPCMPYSDEAADFFYTMMLSMCQLSCRLEDFLGDREALQLAIARRQPLLGA